MSESARIEAIPDIGDVISDDEFTTADDQVGQSNNTVEGEITAIISVDDYPTCVSCKGKVKSVTDVIGECMRCNAKVKISRCNHSNSVKFVVESSEGKIWRLTAFNEQMQAIIDGEYGGSIEEKMLSADKMKFFFTTSNIVKAVRKNI